MLSNLLNKILVGLCILGLLTRLFLQPSLHVNVDTGNEIIANLLNSLLLLTITFFFTIKKIYFNEAIRLPKTLLFLGFYALLAVLSTFYSIDTPSSIIFSLDLFSTFLFILVLTNLLNKTIYIECIITTLVLILTIACLEAIYEYLYILPKILHDPILASTRTFIQLIQLHRPKTIFNWPNILAGFIVMIMPLLWSCYLNLNSLKNKFVLILLIGISLYTLWICKTISSCLGLFISGLIFIQLQNDFFSKLKIKLNKSMLIIGTLVLIGMLTYGKLSSPGGNSFQARYQYLSSSIKLIELHPLIGSGFRSFAVASFPYINDINGRSFFAHNTYLQIWAELGIIGLILFLMFSIYLYRDACFLLKRSSGRMRLWIYALIAGICGCMVDNCFSYTMLKPQTALFWWVLTALIIAAKENLQTSSLRPAFHKTWTKLLLIIVIAVLILGSRLCLAEYAFFQAVDKIHLGKDYSDAQILCLKAKALNPWDKKYDLARAYALYGSFTLTPTLDTLRAAQDALSLTAGQVSLGFERAALAKQIKYARDKFGLNSNSYI